MTRELRPWPRPRPFAGVWFRHSNIHCRGASPLAHDVLMEFVASTQDGDRSGLQNPEIVADYHFGYEFF